MAITIDWDTRVIDVPQSFLTPAVAANSYYLDTNEFRIALRDIEDDVEGIVFPKTHTHNTKVTLSGIEYARVIEIINGYTVTFEEFVGSPYRVFLQGSNNNILDVTNLNNVSVAPSNSAGLVQMQEIEFGEYANGIHINTITGVAGTVHPTGSQRRPSNNITDALQIATVRGVKKFNLGSSLTINESVILSGFVIEGNNHVITELVIGTSAVIDNLKILQCTVRDTTLDGDVDISNCVVRDITYLNGHIHSSGLAGDILLGGSNESVIGDCYTIDADDPPVIDMGGSGNDLSMPNYSGIVTIKNLTSDSEEIGIGLNAGMITLEDTISAGTIVVAGNGILVDNSTGTAAVNAEALMNHHNIAEAVWEYERP